MWATRPNKWKFTSYERDSESNLDYAINRYNSSRLGRFMSPDLLGGHIGNPQSFNRYSYTLNDPTNLSDPLGLIARGPCGVAGNTPCIPDPPPPDDGGLGGGGEGGHGPAPVVCENLDGEDYCGGGGGGSGIDPAVQEAKKKLQDPDCASLFKHPNAGDTLQTYFDNSLIRSSATYNDGRHDKPQHFENNNIGAITVAATGSLPGPDGIRISASVITINPHGPFYSGLTTDLKRLDTTSAFRGLSQLDIQAAMLIHELAHAIPSNIPYPENDSGDDKSNANSQKVFDDCFKPKKK